LKPCIEQGYKVSKNGYEPETRLASAALHLMNQRLALVMQQTANRNTRRRLERESPSLSAGYRLVTLRLSRDRAENPEHCDVAWSCQWTVGGHCSGDRRARRFENSDLSEGVSGAGDNYAAADFGRHRFRQREPGKQKNFIGGLSKYFCSAWTIRYFVLLCLQPIQH